MLVTSLTVLCGVAVLFIFVLLPGESNAAQRAPFWGVCCAHRGLHSQDRAIPENSTAAFTAAIDAGYAIELDIQLSKDGKVVVFHDDELKRVCGENGRVDSYTLEELQAFGLFGTQYKIPTLEQVLQLVDGQVPLVIEYKTSKSYKKLCHAAWTILRQYNGDICIQSFDPRVLRMFYKHAPGVLRGQLAAKPKVLGSGVAGVVVGLGLCNFIGRPNYIAYKEGRLPFSIWLARRFAMRAVWTATEPKRHDALCQQNDMVIFEGYRPEPRFHEPLQEPARNPADEEYRF